MFVICVSVVFVMWVWLCERVKEVFVMCVSEVFVIRVWLCERVKEVFVMCVSEVFVMWVCECEWLSDVSVSGSVMVLFVLCVGCEIVNVMFGLRVNVWEWVNEVLLRMLSVGVGPLDSGPRPSLRALAGHQEWFESKDPYAQ